VEVHFPPVLFFRGGPVGNLEAFEDGTGLSVETDVTDALEQSIRVEVLGVDVVHNVGLLVEFVAIDILDTNTSFASFLDVEFVGHSKDVGVGEFHSVRDVLLNAGAWVENQLNPAGAALMTQVVLEGTADLALAVVGTGNELIDKSFLHRHVFDF